MTRITELEDEIATLRARLEMEPGLPDGIECRDATIAGLERKLVGLEGHLEFIADMPDPSEEQERSATYYRVHLACLKQVAAKALGRQTVSQEAMDAALVWWNSDEAVEARRKWKGEG